MYTKSGQGATDVDGFGARVNTEVLKYRTPIKPEAPAPAAEDLFVTPTVYLSVKKHVSRSALRTASTF